jgi:pimeloyl-ACP methyl ester carboxylesterase
MVVTVGAYSWSSTADRGGPLPASHACAETSMWDSVPLPGPRRGRQEVRCVTLTVPVDDAGRGRGSLGVAVILVRSAGQHDRIGSFVHTAGLPGLGCLPVWASWLPDALPARFHVVTFDPRGTEWSAPIRCEVRPAGPATAATPSPLTDSGFTTAMARLQAQPQICADALGDRAAAISADATVRDLGRPRGATGEDVMTFAGWSYGAWLAVYAYLFPDWARTPIHPALERSLCIARQVIPYLVEVRAPGGHAC